MIMAGSIVRCIWGDDSNYLENGKEYVVEKVLYGGTHISLRKTDDYQGGESSYLVERFCEVGKYLEEFKGIYRGTRNYTLLSETKSDEDIFKGLDMQSGRADVYSAFEVYCKLKGVGI